MNTDAPADAPRPAPSLVPAEVETPIQPEMALPYGPSQERVERVQPVVHVLVATGLQQDAAVLRAHGERVGRLQSTAL